MPNEVIEDNKADISSNGEDYLRNPEVIEGQNQSNLIKDVQDIKGLVIDGSYDLSDSEDDGSERTQAISPPSLSGALHLFHPWWEGTIQDVVTCGPGYFGSYLTLIIKRVGCVDWYKVHHSSMLDPSIFGAILKYKLYLDLDYRFHDFNVVKFFETDDVALPMGKAINEKPLCELTILGSGSLLKGLGLGIMISFVLAASIVPSEMG
ncbi:hypothetical protein H5410_028067 [Solanum commersonii]|uniref:Uncharacterized protein n=1 Tax=Solanum commersonii TaxID=4109 RepID=A0A9J5Z3X2_SOLCO|nr:hypothetical protein H5410_028067 [Solanum commersonii]